MPSRTPPLRSIVRAEAMLSARQGMRTRSTLRAAPASASISPRAQLANPVVERRDAHRSRCGRRRRQRDVAGRFPRVPGRPRQSIGASRASRPGTVSRPGGSVGPAGAPRRRSRRVSPGRLLPPGRSRPRGDRGPSRRGTPGRLRAGDWSARSVPACGDDSRDSTARRPGRRPLPPQLPSSCPDLAADGAVRLEHAAFRGRRLTLRAEEHPCWA